MITIGISGMGRIGRLLVRAVLEQSKSDIKLAAINSTHPAETIAHLLKYDTLHGTWGADIQCEEGALVINGQRIAFVMERDPEKLPWSELGVDIAIDATGKFVDRAGAAKHLEGGARTVIVTAPGKDLDATIVMGVNDDSYDPLRHRLVSAASCTTNCSAPVLKILDDAFKVQNGWLTTVHAVTSDQRLMDNPHADLRRARACMQSIVPTKTGVGKALQDVLPHLAPHIQGLALRVPVQDVSIVDMTLELGKDIDVEEVKRAFRRAEQGSYRFLVELNEEPLVSSDFIGNSRSAVIDGLSMMASGNRLKLLAWYDNEWGYVCRVADLTELAASKLEQIEPEPVLSERRSSI